MKATCSVDGCDRSGKIVRGMCMMHYKRVWTTGTTDILPRPEPLVCACSIEGCDRDAKSGGMCQMHYDRLRNRGTTEPFSAPSPAERLAAELVRMPNGCLEWTGRVDRKNYGMTSINNKRIFTHRLAWMLANGAIPDGLNVLHHCDNPPCAQTDPTEGYPEGHLFLGTIADNNRDMSTKGRNHNTVKTHCPQGHEYTLQNTYVRPSKGTRKCRTCGIAYTARWLKESRAS